MPKRLTLEDLRDKRKKHEKVGDLELIQAILDKFEFWDKKLEEVMGTHAKNFNDAAQSLMLVDDQQAKRIADLLSRVDALESSATTNNMKGEER